MTALILRFWKPLSLIAALVALIMGFKLYVSHVDHTARTEQKAADAAAVTLAQSQARAADLANARAVEATNTAKKEKADDDLAPALANARARLAVYAAQLRNQAAQGGGGAAGVPSTADAASIIIRSDQAAVLDDLDRCTENTVRLQNAQAWVNSLARTP